MARTVAAHTPLPVCRYWTREPMTSCQHHRRHVAERDATSPGAEDLPEGIPRRDLLIKGGMVRAVGCPGDDAPAGPSRGDRDQLRPTVGDEPAQPMDAARTERQLVQIADPSLGALHQLEERAPDGALRDAGRAADGGVVLRRRIATMRRRGGRFVAIRANGAARPAVAALALGPRLTRTPRRPGCTASPRHRVTASPRLRLSAGAARGPGGRAPRAGRGAGPSAGWAPG